MLNIHDIIVDAELEALLPPLSSEETAELIISIGKDGFTDPIIVWLGQGILVDGHNRLRIWNDNGANEDESPVVVEKAFKDRDAVKEWMLRRQLARRNLTDAMRVKVALLLKPILKAKAETRMKSGVADPDQNSGQGSNKVDREIAKAAGVSHDTVHKVGVVLDQGSEETKASMLAGETSVRKAYQETKSATAPFAAEPPSPEPSAPKQQNKPLGVGVERAHEAIACLKRIPAGDALRKRAFEIVSDWMKHNK